MAQSHPVLRQGLMEIINIVKKDYPHFVTLLVFLTPPSVFDEWKTIQRVETTRGEEIKNTICEQEVWCMQSRDEDFLW